MSPFFQCPGHVTAIFIVLFMVICSFSLGYSLYNFPFVSDVLINYDNVFRCGFLKIVDSVLTLFYMLNNNRRCDWLHKHNAKHINLHEWFFIICLKPPEKQWLYILNNDTYPFVDPYYVRLCTKSFMGFFFLNFLFWSVVHLQCGVNFCSTAKYSVASSFSYSVLSRFITGYWIKFPVLYGRILLTYSIHNSYIHGFITMTTTSWNSC